MPLSEHDASFLWDMLKAARSIGDFIAGVTYEQYLRDSMRQRAVERTVEIIGEAARNISEEFKTRHPDIPWRRIVAQRHVLAHEYGEIMQDRIWLVATLYVPELIEKLAPLAPPPPAD